MAGAKRSGGTGSRLKTKNQAMAARMKAENEVRSTCRCPVCHALVGINSLPTHLATGKCR